MIANVKVEREKVPVRVVCEKRGGNFCPQTELLVGQTFVENKPLWPFGENLMAPQNYEIWWGP